MKYIIQILRVLTGLLFIFSGIVKANDPSGLANKMAEFFEPSVLNMPKLVPYALTMSVIMIAGEIILGVTLLIGFAFRFFAWFLLALNIFFTFLTAYVYYWDVIKHSAKVRECGCFGDCIKISNSATFWKDVILLAIAILLFVYRKQIRPILPKYPNTALFVLTVFFAIGVQWYALEHLPYYDCMPYKVGNSICEGMKPPTTCVQDSIASVFIYKHGGKTDEVTMDRIGEIDSTWEFVDRRDKVVRKGNGQCDAPIKDFAINGYDGTNYTDAVLQSPGYTYLLFLRDPMHARTDNMAKLQALAKEAQAKGIQFLVLTSGAKEATEAWRQKWNLAGAEYYTFDQTASKTAIRTDPGLMLLQGCFIRGKWSFRDYPAHAVDSTKH